MGDKDSLYFQELKDSVEFYSTVPSFEEMGKRTLADKGINGPTAAHVIEEVHTPLNYAYITFTTGTTAWQNLVGITPNEKDYRRDVGKNALKMAGVKEGDKAMFCYPPLLNAITRNAPEEIGVSWTFLTKSSRDSFLMDLYYKEPNVIFGESSFIKCALQDAIKLDLVKDLPQVDIVNCIGTPLDLDAVEIIREVLGARVNDIYGTQEFGWITMNGKPVREDISLVRSKAGLKCKETVVGGLPTGDSFPVVDSGHVLDKDGKIITYMRKRTIPDYEIYVRETTVNAKQTIERASRSILRIKSKIVKVPDDVVLESDRTVLELLPSIIPKDYNEEPILIEGPTKTVLFDLLVQAQLDYQNLSVKDPCWIKSR
ncbi:MAG: acyl carrier protein [Candidatus Methanofastidiosa archaeon]|nr:acyl carrier protein [Candidatus Methanofastidiosa archaeon]